MSTDLELTKACAEAMELDVVLTANSVYIVIANEPPEWTKQFASGGQTAIEYDPLRDDAQAMALVKKCNLTIIRNSDDCHSFWTVTDTGFEKSGHDVDNDDLNRAIVECVAKMQKAKP